MHAPSKRLDVDGARLCVRGMHSCKHPHPNLNLECLKASSTAMTQAATCIASQVCTQRRGGGGGGGGGGQVWADLNMNLP